MSTAYTHRFTESGNGFPSADEDCLLMADGNVPVKLVRIAECSSIQTRQWESNWIDCTITDSPNDWNDMSEAHQDEAYESLHAVSAIDEGNDNDEY